MTHLPAYHFWKFLMIPTNSGLMYSTMSVCSVLKTMFKLILLTTIHPLVQVFRILHKMAPPYLWGLFQYSATVTGHHSHNPSRLYVPQVRTNYRRQSLYFWGTMLWNNLPPSSYYAESITQFRRRLHASNIDS